MYDLHVLPLSFLTQSKLLRQWAQRALPDQKGSPLALMEHIEQKLAAAPEEVQMKLMAEGVNLHHP
jgi:hypothetical protein